VVTWGNQCDIELIHIYTSLIDQIGACVFGLIEGSLV